MRPVFADTSFYVAFDNKWAKRRGGRARGLTAED